MNKISVCNINTDKFNPFGATSEELVANALEEAGLVKENTEINNKIVRNICTSYYVKRENYRELTKLGNLLIKRNIITAEDLQKALNYQVSHSEVKIGDILLKLELCSEEDIQQSLNAQIQVREDIIELDSFKSKIFIIKERLKNLLS